MTITYSKLFEPSQLSTAAATVVTIPASSLLRGGRARLTNITAAGAAVTIYAVPAGASASDANALLKGKVVPANDFIDIDLPLLKAGDILQGLSAVASAITIHSLAGAYTNV